MQRAVNAIREEVNLKEKLHGRNDLLIDVRLRKTGTEDELELVIRNGRQALKASVLRGGSHGDSGRVYLSLTLPLVGMEVESERLILLRSSVDSTHRLQVALCGGLTELKSESFAGRWNEFMKESYGSSSGSLSSPLARTLQLMPPPGAVSTTDSGNSNSKNRSTASSEAEKPSKLSVLEMKAKQFMGISDNDSISTG